VLVGVVAVVGLLAYLVWQGTQPEGNSFAGAARTEADPAPDLPGEFVNLQKIYGGSYGATEGPNTAEHVTRDVDYVNDCAADDETVCNTNPPAGGPHWGSSACPEDPTDAPPYCGPVGWGLYREPWPAEALVHNMEHGGLVLWYNTTNQEIIDELEDIAERELNGEKLFVMAPYPDMEPETIALTAWARIDKFPVSEYSEERVDNFIEKLKCRFNPETMSGAGC
jgi:hypothetical protein